MTQRVNRTPHLHDVWAAICRKDRDWPATPLALAEDEQLEDGVLAFCHIDTCEMFTDTDDGPNLGPVPRLILLLDYLGQSDVLKEGTRAIKRTPLLQRSFAAAIEAAGLPASGKGLRNHADRVQLSSQDNHRAKEEWPIIERGLVSLLNTHHKVQDVFDEAALFEQPFIGRTALDRFNKLIRHEGPVSEPALKFIAESHDRAELPGMLVRAILEDGPNKPMLINVFAEGRWRDAGALSLRIKRDIELADPDQKKQVLRIPLARYAQTEEENPGNPNDPYRHSLSFDEVLGKLSKAFDLEGEGTGYPDGRFDAAVIIQRIRRRMALETWVIIFEGYYQPDDTAGSGGEIHRIVRDDHLNSLIMRLCEPPIADFQQSSADQAQILDIETFKKSRLVVFSNRVLSYFCEETSAPVDFYDQPLPPPNRSEMRAILKACRLPHRKALLNSVEGSNLRLSKIVHEPFFDLLSAHMELLTAHDEGYLEIDSEDEDARHEYVERLLGYLFQDEDFPDESGGAYPNENRDAAIMQWLMTIHLNRLRQYSPDLYQLHLFLTIVPCGLKHTTLLRIARRMRNLKLTLDGTPQDIPFSDLLNETVLAQLPDRVATQPGCLLTGSQIDVFHSFDTAPDLFETLVLPGAGLRRSNGYDFDDPMMKEVAEAVMASLNTLSPSDIHVLHRMLSDEALSQQTTALTHRGADYLQSIRTFRRQISGIYHGYLSLPLNVINGRPTIDDALVIYSPYLAGPPQSTAYFEWIYFFIFRRMIERPPAWNLSRHYALDRLKRELLEGADCPWALMGSIARDGAFDPQASLFAARYKEDRPEIYEDFLVNLLHALTALSDIDAAYDIQNKRISNALPKSDPGKGDTPLPVHGELKRLKDTLDLNIVRRSRELDPCWADFWNVMAGGQVCLLYTSDAADDLTRVVLAGRRIVNTKTTYNNKRP